MDMSIRFPGLNLVLDYVPRSFEIFGFEITIYGVLIAIGMLLGIFFVVLEARRNHEIRMHIWIWPIITLAFRCGRGEAALCSFFLEPYKMIRDSF